MEAIGSAPISSNSRKRSAPDEDSPEKRPLNLKGTQFMMPTPPDTDQSSDASPTCTKDGSVRQPSPAPSSSALSSVETVSNNPVPTAGIPPGHGSNAPSAPRSGPPPAKKRKKLTLAEKEQQRVEKEARDATKAEEKAKKDEEKRARDEDKRKRAEEREAKKREKEIEDERKAQDKLKKERSQMRLGAWFRKPATPAKDPADVEAPFRRARSKSLSLEPFDAVADQITSSESPNKSTALTVAKHKTPAKPAVSDYHKYFLPFELKPHCSMPTLRSSDNRELAQQAFDHDVNDPSIREKNGLGLVDSYASLERQFADERDYPRGHRVPSMRLLVDQIQGSIEEPIDLTNDEPPANPMDVLQSVTRRYLEFSEDVRPAYFGTYTKIRSPGSSKRLSRNPFRRARPDTDYDYDSEAEWEEPEEGEEILDEDEDEAESLGDAREMDEFLDDAEDAAKATRKMITGDLVPTSTGLCWEDGSGRIMPSVEGGSPAKAMRGMRMGVLLLGVRGATIDPFSTAYWQNDILATAPPAPAAEPSTTSIDRLTAPPRAPLLPRANNNTTLDHKLVGTSESMKGPINSLATTQSSKANRKLTPRRLSKEDLDEFKDAVVGSQSSKADLLKVLKARFPKHTNSTIKTTLGDHFAQVGANKADKKWVYVSDS